MRIPSLLGQVTAGPSSLIRLWPLLSTLISSSLALNFNTVPSPNLDLSQLGRVGLAGDFDAVSLYQYTDQSENGFNANGSQAIITQLPNGEFVKVVGSDAYITTMCPFVMSTGKLAGIVVGGNFTSLGGMDTQAVALFDPNSGKITPLPGLTGKVNILYCDQSQNSVYVGGEFRGANSTNAIAWVGTDGWTNLPFEGFNGPVRTITASSNGTVLFGGEFTGLGNSTGTSPTKKDQQVINLSSAEITSGLSTTTAGFSDPKNIICKTSGQSGAGNTWLVQDSVAGFWKASFGFGFQPTKLTLWNTNQDGRGTKTFRFTALPINGIMNLTYTDDQGVNRTCDARCPLPQTTEPQDFHFVNVIGMSAFQLDISDWYGPGAGLNGIALYEDDIYAFAVNDFNEPACAGADFPSTATATGPWASSPSQQSNSGFLMANFADASIASGSASVIFKPDIKQSGNYSVTIYTPGCAQDNSCATRGRVSITGEMATGTSATPPIQSDIFQTNLYDKYDLIYNGHVDAASGSFRPTVTLTPSPGQAGNLDFVAQRVRFQLLNSTGGLNGIFEFNPSLQVVSTDFSTSVYDKAGMGLDTGALINSLVVVDKVTYAGGNFSTGDFQNIMMIPDSGNATALADGGLNAEVFVIYADGSTLYVGGNFTNTSQGGVDDLSNIAIYSTTDKKWQALGAGVNGRVCNIVPFSINVTSGKPETVIGLSGDFDQIFAFGNNPAIPVDGLAVWVPSQHNWLENLNAQVPSISGRLQVGIAVPNTNITLFGGSLSSQALSAGGAISLSTQGTSGISSLPVKIQPQNIGGSSRKRALQGQNITGVVDGYFYENSNRNVTILGGHFTAKATNGSTLNNLIFINGSNSDQVTGLDSGVDADSVFLTLAVNGDTLFAGGELTGTVGGSKINGLVVYDLIGAKYARQPPALTGPNVIVNAISVQPGGSGDVYVGGSFDSAGSLGCESMCVFATSNSQWVSPGGGLSGEVGDLMWSGNNKLIIGGNLTLNNSGTSVAMYDTKAKAWSPFVGASTIPGPVSALTPATADVSQWWAAGTSLNGSAFLVMFDGFTWHSIGDQFGPNTQIRGLQALSVTQSHATSSLMDKNTVLLITGALNLPNFGNVSAVLYNGSNVSPFVLANTADNSPGSLATLFSQKQDFFKTHGGQLAVGFVVLIALAISLALIFILVVIGIFFERIRRKREGYVPAPTQMYDKHSNMDRIPPSHLFESIGHSQNRGPGGAPMI